MPGILELLGFNEEVRNTAQFIESMVQGGVGSTEIYNTLVQAGLGKRKQTVLQTIRQVRNIQSKRSYVNSLGLDYLPNPERFARAIFPQSKKYAYIVRLEGVNEDTEKPDNQYISIVSDKVITKREAIQTALHYIENPGAQYNFTPKNAVVENITLSPDSVAA